MPKPPGSSTAKPPAGTAPAPPFGLPPEDVLRESGINSYVIDAVTDVNRKATAMTGADGS